MSNALLTDDAVIKALQDEAKSASARFLTQGLGAYIPRKTTGQAPKTNTRFLKNLIRETDSHNQALLAKEAEDARLRLREFRNKDEKDRREERDRARRLAGRGLEEDVHRTKRRRVDMVDRDRNRLSPPKESHRYIKEGPSIRARSRSRERRKPSRSRSRSGEHRSQGQRGKGSDNEHEDRHSSRRVRSEKHTSRRDREDDDHKHRRRRHEGSRSRSRERHRDRRKRHRSSSRSSSSNERRSHCRSHCRSHRRHRRHSSSSSNSSRRKSPSQARRPSDQAHAPQETHIHGRNEIKEQKSHTPQPNLKATAQETDANDSDPLEEIVGPMPPPPQPKPRIRGRGAITSSSNIDARFSSTYDPSIDITIDEDDDWGQALEALQARAKLKSSQGERLRAAGFTDEEIRNWEKGGGEKNEDDVRWAKVGEGREWDRGKVLDKDGGLKDGVDLEYGRLK